ncbi:MAG TPA: chemotaxis protein CheW [Allocoleopsis sp.]
MDNKQYLTFRLHDVQYGIEAPLVQEIFSLPELTLIAEAPSEIMGILNVRGQIVPIVHLDLLQGNRLKECQLSDYVLLLQWEGLQIGLVVHQVTEVLELSAETIESEPPPELLGNLNPTLSAGIAKGDSGHIILLDPKTLIHQPDTLLTFIWDIQSQLDSMTEVSISEVDTELKQDELELETECLASEHKSNFYDLYSPNSTLEEREIFHQRAEALKQLIESAKATNQLTPLAVFSFGDDHFGMDLGLVKEFTDISNLTPIPCCPKHIVGNMNLRGEIVTLVDIRSALNLPTPPIKLGAQVVVVQVDDIVAGLPVDRVLEMTYLNSDELSRFPAILSDFGEPYLQGTAAFEEKMLRVLDLPKLFTEGGLVVNEEA